MRHETRFWHSLAAALIGCALLGAPARASTPNSAFADDAFERVNAERVARGVPALARVRVLELAAQLQAMDMANRMYMNADHSTAPTPTPVTPDPVHYPNIRFRGGWFPNDRMLACGFTDVTHGWWGENAAWGEGADWITPQFIVQEWMDSPHHRQNILDTNFKGGGMGVAVSASGRVYYCQCFAESISGWPRLDENADLFTTDPAPTGDTVAPAGWTLLSPASVRTTTVVCVAQVVDSVSGLNVNSARYRFSRDGGSTWSQWAAATCTGEPGTTAAQQVRASVAFGQQSSANQVQFQVSDQSGNTGVSPAYGIVTDGAAPGGWSSPLPARTRDRTPDCSVRVSDTVSGLNVSGAWYRYSTNGGMTWRAWRRASCTGAGGSTSVETISAPGVPFNVASANRCRIQYRISDRAGNVATSPSYTVNTAGG